MFYKKILSFFILFVWNFLWKLAISKLVTQKAVPLLEWVSRSVYYYGLGLEAAQEMKPKNEYIV